MKQHSLRLNHAMHAITSSDGGEHRRREAGVEQSMKIQSWSCRYVSGWVMGMYGIWNYLANQFAQHNNLDFRYQNVGLIMGIT